MKLKFTTLTVALLAGLLSTLQTANAADSYVVRVNDVYVRRAPKSYAMGRLYKNERMDIQYIDGNGWAYGYAYGFVNRCLWAQFREGANPPNFTLTTKVRDRCQAPHTLPTSEFTNGQIWSNASGDDGVLFTLKRATNIWDNWSWGAAWGNHRHRGTAPAGDIWKIRYTTKDGGGVMARRCSNRSNCESDWVFIERRSIGSQL